jgi:DtxR family Mn-dependent transcriptional regulator
VVDIKNLMNVKTPSVSGALEVLAGHNLIKHERYGRVQLTKQGAQIAAEVKKKHATIALFLKEIIGVATEVADIDACKIEHAISKETFLKLANFVENFKNRT